MTMQSHQLPHFSSIDPSTFTEKLDKLLQENLSNVTRLLQQKHFDWDSLFRPLEDMDDAVEKLWAPLSHLNAVTNTSAIRDCYSACLPLLSSYESKISQNHALYQAIQSIDVQNLTSCQSKIIRDTLRNFELAGVAAPNDKKIRLEEIAQELSKLTSAFDNNVLDTVNTFYIHIKDEEKLVGVPSHTLEQAKESAEKKGLSGWILTLDAPCFIAISTYADNRKLREDMYYAYVTRASDQGPLAGKYDNSNIMTDILKLRHEEALLLNFPNYAMLSLATKMVNKTDEVMSFLQDLADKAYPQAIQEFQALQTFAKNQYKMDSIKPWDIAYLSEKKRQKEYAVSQEEIRAYFPLSNVLSGLFKIVETLYGIYIEPIKHADVWHQDVICYVVSDEHRTPRGYIYFDLFARASKRGGAWMNSLRGRRRLTNGEVQLPIATLTCNFSAPLPNQEVTLLHEEVLTLFHELGHCLHHVLTQVDFLSASGMNGVEWDAVELPSQFFENWCWDEKSLQILTKHTQTQAPMPHDVCQKLIVARNFQSAMAMVRQLEFSLFDMRIHTEYTPNKPTFIENILKEVRDSITVIPVEPYNRFQHSFSHIFAGGYAAGYYSYKWAEVLSSDAFSRFEKEGIFNQQTGREFLHSILEVGSSVTAKEAFMRFQKRAPQIDALLRHNGIFS